VDVVGLDEFNHGLLRSIYRDDCDFRALLAFDEVKGLERYPLLDLAETGLGRAMRERPVPDAVMGFWDFPVTTLFPWLARELGLPGPDPQSALAMEHKFWSRRLQRRADPAHTPAFARVDPFADDPLQGAAMAYPFWVKPVKAYSSWLGFRVENDRDLHQAMQAMRRDIAVLQEPFEAFMRRAGVDEEVVAGGFAIAEAIIQARHQCTLCGYVVGGQPVCYGFVDSIREPGGSTFSRFQYPSSLPPAVLRRMEQSATRVVAAHGYDQAAFNIEYFWDPEQDSIRLLELNPRISQTHGDLFRRVDGEPNHAVAVALALGERPAFPYRQGEHGVAAKCYLRAFRDGVVAVVPGPKDLERVRSELPDARVHLNVRPGQRLSELPMQESYSYELGHVYLGGEDEDDLLDKFQRCRYLLPFEITPA
jgi:hypothetical protein